MKKIINMNYIIYTIIALFGTIYLSFILQALVGYGQSGEGLVFSAIVISNVTVVVCTFAIINAINRNRS